MQLYDHSLEPRIFETLIELKMNIMSLQITCSFASHLYNLFFRSNSIFGLWMATPELANGGWSYFSNLLTYRRNFAHCINHGQLFASCIYILYLIWNHLPYHDYCCQVSWIYSVTILSHALEVSNWVLQWNTD